MKKIIIKTKSKSSFHPFTELYKRASKPKRWKMIADFKAKNKPADTGLLKRDEDYSHFYTMAKDFASKRRV